MWDGLEEFEEIDDGDLADIGHVGDIADTGAILEDVAIGTDGPLARGGVELIG